MIKVKDVVYEYAQTRETLVAPALNGVSLSISEGEYVCIIGNNGGGKSTLAMQLNGILKPTSGTVFIDNIKTENDELIFEIRRKVGIVFQNPDNQIISSSVNEDATFGPENLGMESEKIREVVDKSLDVVQLSEYKNYLVNKLSGGQKQRLAIAGVLAMEPKYIILDEATSMLDKSSARQVLEIMKKLNAEKHITIIHITHNMEEVALANRAIAINQGKIVMDDKPSEIFKNAKLLKELYLDIPIAMQLIYELNNNGINISSDILTCDECVDALVELLKGANIDVSNKT